MKDFVFFTLNDFEKEGGGTIRMLGIINELAKTKAKITLISNIKNSSKVAGTVKHIPINFEVSREDKRKIQFILGTFGYKKLNGNYAKLLERLKEIYSTLKPDSQFIFFEYLDNSIGYWLKKNQLISAYSNDIHGIASNEFAFQQKRATSLRSKWTFALKKRISQRLDQKVFDNTAGIFFASEAMKQYFYNLYPSLKKKKNIFLPYVLNAKNLQPVDFLLKEKLRKELNLKESDFVFLFAGAYKETGGIQDLIKAFDKVSEKYPQAKLLLVGDGGSFEDCQKLAYSQKSSDKIFFLGRQPYDYLPTFQDLAQVIVCPDRQNLFSDLIVHVKYLDALVSGKIVINGNFKSVAEINKDQKLSLLFIPSNIEDLAKKMLEAVADYEILSKHFETSKEYTLQNLTYSNYIHNLLAD